MSRQYQIPGGKYVNETGKRQEQIPGSKFVNETVAVFQSAWAVAVANVVVSEGARTS